VELTELILQTQTPPFDKLGAFRWTPSSRQRPHGPRHPAEQYHMRLRVRDLARGRLDIQSLLFTEDGGPRHSVFYLAHLSDAERMFFVTLLFTAVESWMRTQSGSAALRALLYMDEIYGYLPPTANPPSKQPLLRMLKQARAFGLGLLLATQNRSTSITRAFKCRHWFIGAADRAPSCACWMGWRARPGVCLEPPSISSSLRWASASLSCRTCTTRRLSCSRRAGR
jgi:hypothetical protein